MIEKMFLILLLQAWVSVGWSSPAQEGSFQVPERLQRNYDFWLNVYSKYSTDQALIHDSKYIDKIYEVLDFRGLRSSARTHRAQAARMKWKVILLSVQKKQMTHEALTVQEQKAFDLYRDVEDPSRFAAASTRKRIRYQPGQSDVLLNGYRHAAAYIPDIESIFLKNGLPLELSRIPYIESSYNLRAKSKVGASGIWQLMPNMDQLGLEIDAAIDERNDPVRSAEGAARLLKANYDSLGRWDLAVTAYNHGRQSLMRAERRFGEVRLGWLAARMRGRGFGFSSGNFFVSLLAAITAERQLIRARGLEVGLKPTPYREVVLDRDSKISDLVRRFRLKKSNLIKLNPAMTDATIRGRLKVPRGYHLRLPGEHAEPTQHAAN